jgi:hypothetical protein
MDKGCVRLELNIVGCFSLCLQLLGNLLHFCLSVLFVSVTSLPIADCLIDSLADWLTD